MSKKKALIVATVAGHINTFHIPYIEMLKRKGYEVHIATKRANEVVTADKGFEIPFERNPLKKNNIKAYKELKKIIDENKYEIIHCHTPTAGVVTRLAARKTRKTGTKVIYTAHGFHFYKGAPLINWMIYYPIEKWMSKYTDCLITITQEDYKLAKSKFKKVKQIEHVNGVGFKSDKLNVNITEEEKIQLREFLKIKPNDLVLSYIAELNANKNQIVLIKAIKDIKNDIPNIKLLLIGSGILKDFYSDYIEKEDLKENVILLGQRKDVAKLLSITDIYVASSIREGLPVNIMEAMCMGLPIIATDNRGHRELIKNEKNGYVIDLKMAQEEFVNKVRNMYEEKSICINFGKESKAMVEVYELKNILKKMEKIYSL